MILPYKEGSVFAFPLRGGGYATGIVARIANQGAIVLAYFYGPAWEAVPSMDQVKDLRPSEALRVARVGDLSLMDQTWPIIGQLESWKRQDWPMPPFVRRDDIGRNAWRVQYSDADANSIAAETPINYQSVTEFERDAVLGAGAAEIGMTRLLKDSAS